MNRFLFAACGLALCSLSQAAVPAVVSAKVVSSFGNFPLKDDQLKALNEILAVSDPGSPAKPSGSTPATPAKTTPVKPKKDDKKPQPPSGRTIDVVNADGKTASLNVDPASGTFTNLKVPASESAAVKALFESLNLTTPKKAH